MSQLALEGKPALRDDAISHLKSMLKCNEFVSVRIRSDRHCLEVERVNGPGFPSGFRCLFGLVAVNDGVKLSSEYPPFGINVRRKNFKTNVCERSETDVR
jgi:hypothetical protein